MKLEEKKVREKRAKRIKKSYKRKIGNRMKSQKKKQRWKEKMSWNERCLNKKKKKIDEHGGKWRQAVREEERKEIVIKRL